MYWCTEGPVSEPVVTPLSSGSVTAIVVVIVTLVVVLVILAICFRKRRRIKVALSDSFEYIGAL